MFRLLEILGVPLLILRERPRSIINLKMAKHRRKYPISGIFLLFYNQQAIILVTDRNCRLLVLITIYYK